MMRVRCNAMHEGSVRSSDWRRAGVVKVRNGAVGVLGLIDWFVWRAECVYSSESEERGGWRGEGVMNSVAGCGRAVGNEGVNWCKQRADLDPDGMGQDSWPGRRLVVA